MSQERILIVEDETNERTGLAELISAWGYQTETAADGEDGWAKVESWGPAIVLTDLKMPRMDGMQLLEQIAESPQQIAVILLTAMGSVDAAVNAMKRGAFDFIEKPVNPNRLRNILQNAARLRGTERELEASRRRLRDVGVLGSLVGSSTVMQEIFRLVEMVAPSTASVLITGDSGTGKELVARTIHSLSSRKSRPFVAINCAAIPETLIESEVFGHEKGAFTGAFERRTGCFELAEGGTLLLDEIGEMPIGTQAKLLRVLEDRKLRRLGAKSETAVDVRVLAATNKPPEEAVARGDLRNDLYYRLNVFNIHMPPLRDHLDDLPDLVHSLLADMNEKHDRSVGGVSDAVMNAFRAHAWPGNVRELRNTLERAVIICNTPTVEPKHLPPGFGKFVQRIPLQDGQSIQLGVGTTVDEAERLLILKTLESTHNNKTKAAEILGISLKTLHNKLKEYGHHGSAGHVGPDAAAS
ncbi:MAG TPA: sigma-54 dependent transcriptional regulator [Candidatus Angelobacter sp.]|jgi:DNA-binding NtrC family response regulator|nr:sigma-54 dependent transcriptional regulator [Candidatus Angelobacter sp.]